MHVIRNPPLDDRLVDSLVDLWATVTNAGGAVGFVAPVTRAEVRPVADLAFARVRDGLDDLVVALEDGLPLGFGFLVRNTDPLSPHWATVKRLQRHPTRRGAGVGVTVLRDLEALAAERGLERVVLTVRGRTGRERFYYANGYRLLAVMPRWLRLGEDDYRESLLLGKRVDGGADPQVEVPMEVVRLDPELPLPAYARPGDAGLDLHARETVTLEAGARAVVPTGVAVAVPAGCVGLVHARSGLAVRHGIALVNAPGTIDAGYRGEVAVVLVNLDPTEPVTLQRGDRIAQLVVQRVETVRVVEVASLPPSGRGEDGFGSTGR